MKRLLAMLAIVALVGCSGGGDEAPAPDGAVTEPTPEVTAEEPQEEFEADAEIRTATVEIYFPSASGNGLIGEYREIFDTPTPGDRAKQIVADLISGPSTSQALRAVAPGTRLRQAYVVEGGVAYLDFSQELTEGIGGGSQQEILTVYSIVDSVALGVREIQRVVILVNGRPIETLNGHLDLRRPLKPNPRLILGSTTI